jgi:hypothetical protein
MKVLIGHTGLVGSTLLKSQKFDYVFNSKNIASFNELVNDGYELYLSCLPATKWLVNKNLNDDIKNIHNLVSIIGQKKYSKVILISTIDIYNDSPLQSNEDYNPNISKLSYGANRYIFELMVKELVKTDNLKIFRLPSLFNNLIKKNIIFDLLNNNNVNQINANSSYQWYNLDTLSNDIIYYSEQHKDRTVFNLFNEPINTIEIVELFPEYIDLVTYSKNKLEYHYKTNLTASGYIMTKDLVLADIKKFIYEVSHK